MSEPQEKEARHYVSMGDIGVIVIALVFALSTIYLFVGPSPFAALFVKHPPPPQSNEVSVSLPPPSGAKP